MRDVSAQPDYIKTGYSPVTVVSIPDADLEFTTTLKSSGTIVRTSKPFGGFEQVATLNISNLELGEDLSLATSVTIDRYDDHETLRGTGQVSSVGEFFQSYESSRDAVTGNVSDALITVGQQYDAGLLRYTTTRGYLQFEKPAMTTLEEATLYFPGLNKFSLVDFDIVAVIGDWSSLSTGLFNDFDGWQSSGDYTDDIEQLNEPFSTSEFFVFDGSQADEDDQYVHIRFNKAGRDAILAATGGVIRIMLISKNDVESTKPTANEFVLFTAPTTTLRLRYNTISLNNKSVNVYRYYGTRPAAYSDMLELFRGVVKSHRITLRTLDIEIRRDEGSVNVVLPKTVMTEEDYPNIHKDNIGRRVPIVYGDFSRNVNLHDNTGYFTEEENLGLVTGYGGFASLLADTGKEYYLAASHAIHTIDDFGLIWGANNNYSVLPTLITEISTGLFEMNLGDIANFPYYLTTLTSVADMKPLASKVLYVDSIGNATTAIDPTYCQDEDPTNWTKFTDNTHRLLATSTRRKKWDVTDLIGKFAIVFEMFAPNGWGTNSVRVNYVHSTDEGGIIYNEEEFVSHNGQFVYTKTNPELNDNYISFSIFFQAVVGFDPDFPVWVRNISIVRAYDDPLPSVLYLSGKGKPDDGSGTITGTPDELIENPSHIIESIARSEMGLATSDIDTADFDEAATALPSWLMAFQWNEKKRGIDRFDKIGEECKGSIFRDELNRLTAKVWLESLGFAHSGTDIPDDLDIFQTSAEISGDSVTKNPILKDSFSLEQTDLRQVFNSFELHFNKNYATNGYRDVITIDNGDGVAGDVETTLTDTDEGYLEFDQTILGLKGLTSSSFVSTQNITNQMIFRADHIRDRATAVKLFQHLIESFSPVRHIVTLTTRENAIWIESGDRVNIRHPRIDEVFGAPTAKRKKWALYRIRHELGSTRMTFSFIEVKVEL